MVARYQQTVYPRGPEKEEEPVESQTVAAKDDDCRCKEASEMSPRELLKLMLSDLSFWKKTKRE